MTTTGTLTLPLGLVLHRRGQLLDDVVAGQHLMLYWLGLTLLMTVSSALYGAVLARDGSGNAAAGWLFLGSMACYAAYGAGAGLFQGGSQVILAAAKAPLIVFAAVILCAPSFYVFGTLAGADLSSRRFLGLMAGFCGMLGLLMLALLPISWLFTVSSNSLLFVVMLHLLVWWVALVFAFRFLAVTVPHPAARAALFVWLALFSIVSYQVTTYLRPVLWREPGAPLVRTEKMFFLEHLVDVARIGTGAKASKPGD